METTYCQSCGMPLARPEDHGTERDGSPSADYCIYCYKDGNFAQDVSMEQMIDHCLQFLGEFNKDSGTTFSPVEARAEMMKYFPTLKRWADPDAAKRG